MSSRQPRLVAHLSQYREDGIVQPQPDQDLTRSQLNIQLQEDATLQVTKSSTTRYHAESSFTAQHLDGQMSDWNEKTNDFLTAPSPGKPEQPQDVHPNDVFPRRFNFEMDTPSFLTSPPGKRRPQPQFTLSFPTPPDPSPTSSSRISLMLRLVLIVTDLCLCEKSSGEKLE